MNNKFHISLSGYFANKPLYLDEPAQKKPNIRKLVEQPWQETKAEMWDEATDTLCNLDFIQAKAANKLTFELVTDINDILEVIPDNTENIREEKARQKRMDKYARDLILYANGEITELDIPDSITPWTEKQIDAEIERIKTNPNRSDRLKDFKNFLGLEANNLENYAHELPHFAIQQAWNNYDSGPVGKAADEMPYEVLNRLILRIPSTRPLWNPMPLNKITLTGHSQSIKAIAITPDGKQAISSSYDNTLIHWDLHTGKAVKILCEHTREINTVSITPDGQWAISGSSDKICILWDLNRRIDIKRLMEHTDSINAVAITPDGKQAVSASDDRTCILWNLVTGISLKKLIGHKDKINDITITPNGRFALSASNDLTCILWDLENGAALQTLRWHRGNVNAVAITPDGKLAISASNDRTCILWDLEKGNPIKILEGHTAPVSSIAITPNGKLALSSSDDKTFILWDLENSEPVLLWDPESAEPNKYFNIDLLTYSEYVIIKDLLFCKPLKIYKNIGSSAGISVDGKYAIIIPLSIACNLCDIERGKLGKPINEHSESINSIKITPDGKYVITASWDSPESTCILWDFASGKLLQTLKGHSGSVSAISITPDSQRAITGSFDNNCIMWDLQSGEPLQTLTGHISSVESVSVTPDGTRILSGSSETCLFWDLKNGLMIYSLQRNSCSAFGIFISQDGKQALSSSSDASTLWDLESGKIINTCEGYNNYRVNLSNVIIPDGKLAVSIFGEEDDFVVMGDICIIWELKSGKILKTLTGTNFRFITITPDGKQALSCSWDATCTLWDLKSGNRLAAFKGYSHPQTDIAITPDGKFVISTSENNTGTMWTLDTGKCVARFIANQRIVCASIHNNILVLGGDAGGIFFLKIPGFYYCIENTTANTLRIWDYINKRFLEPTTDCPLCGHRFVPPTSVLNTVDKITIEAGLNPDQSPCLELPDQYWEDPGLLGICPNCGEKLKFNPFIAGGG